MDVKYTKHAVEEVKKELFREYGNKVDTTTAAAFIKDNMRKATYISEIMNDKGKIDRLYAYRRYCFVLDRRDDCVITVYKRDNVHEDVRQVVQELLFKKLRELEQLEALLVEQRLEADIRLQIITQFNQYFGDFSKSLDVIDELLAWDELKAIDHKLYEFRLEKAKIAKGIAAHI